MKYLVAVSGGIDSVVLLDLLMHTKNKLVVAHVDHGIRSEDSVADARFVRALAAKYGLLFVTTQLHLGPGASEEQARDGRYEFLFAQAKRFGATVITAHHADDAVETICLNLTRGTGWRGLAVLGRGDIKRPLLAYTKAQLYEYALKKRLEWVEDATNRQDKYLRNRLRSKIGQANIDTTTLLELRDQQLQLRYDIDAESARLAEQYSHNRYFLNMLDTPTALELLGAIIQRQTNSRPARPQLARALHAIKTATPGATCQVGDGVALQFTARNYLVTVL